MTQQDREAKASSREEDSQTSGDEPSSHGEPRREYTVPKSSEGDKSPPVDEELLRALVRQELPESQKRDVFLLIHSFKDWDDVHARILAEEFQAKQTKDDGGGD